MSDGVQENSGFGGPDYGKHAFSGLEVVSRGLSPNVRALASTPLARRGAVGSEFKDPGRDVEDAFRGQGSAFGPSR